MTTAIKAGCLLAFVVSHAEYSGVAHTSSLRIQTLDPIWLPSVWKHFKTLSLDESRSPDFDLFSDQEEYSKEEVAKTMEQYMSKTRANYGSGIARPKIEDKDSFELKGQFLKELRDNTFSGSDHENANEHIEKVLEIMDLFHIPNITIDQAMLKAFPMSPLHQRLSTQGRRENPRRSLLHSIWCTFSKRGYRATALGFYQRNNANPSYQERRQSMEETLSKFIGESAKRHEENSNLIKEIRALTDVAIRNQEASIKNLEIQIRKINKVLQERGFGSLPSSIETNPRDHVKSISTIVETDSYPIRRIGFSHYAVSTKQSLTLMYETKQTTIPFLSRLNGYYYEEKKESYGSQFSKSHSEASHVNNSIPKKEKDTRRLGDLAHTKLAVELADKSMKYPKGIVENVLVGIGKFVFPIDFIILAMPEDIKVPLIIGRPFLSTAHAKIDVYKKKITLRIGEEKIIFKSIKPTRSLIKRVYVLSLRERMELDLEARLIGETLVLNRSLDPFFEDYIELNDLNVPLELRRDQVDDLMPTIKECEVVEEFRARNNAIMDSKIFGYPNFAVLEDMDAYRDEGMGDVIFGKPFLREVGINAKWFEGMITINNGNEEDTYQMAWSHPRFKYHTNEQCNKILTLLKDLAESKEIDEVGEVSIIWNLMCDCSHAASSMSTLTSTISLSSDDTSSSSYSLASVMRPLFLIVAALEAEALELRRASLALTLLYLTSKSLVGLSFGLC
ncbi:mitochondrial proton/calcium exchanger protein-like protein isoform X1 [Tanacetum coccineum]